MTVFAGQRSDQMWVSFKNDSFVPCDWEGTGDAACYKSSEFAAFIDNVTVVKEMDTTSGRDEYKMAVQSCNVPLPFAVWDGQRFTPSGELWDGQRVTNATYALARNPDTGCGEDGEFGSLEIQDVRFELDPRCNGTSKVALEEGNFTARMATANDFLNEYFNAGQ